MSGALLQSRISEAGEVGGSVTSIEPMNMSEAAAPPATQKSEGPSLALLQQQVGVGEYSTLDDGFRKGS
eukprot:27455-Eustigmatos_ZCMA.PRE.1